VRRRTGLLEQCLKEPGLSPFSLCSMDSLLWFDLDRIAAGARVGSGVGVGVGGG
jgi:hypothetical protein